MRATFNFFDTDGSGSISPEECHKVLESLGLDFDIDHITDVLADMGGEVCYEDYLEILNDKYISRDALRVYFDAFDQDRSGYVTAAEWRHFMTNLGQDLTDGEVDVVLDLYDTTGTGQMNLRDFEGMLWDLGYTVEDEKEGQNEDATMTSEVTATAEEPREDVPRSRRNAVFRKDVDSEDSRSDSTRDTNCMRPEDRAFMMAMERLADENCKVDLADIYRELQSRRCADPCSGVEGGPGCSNCSTCTSRCGGGTPRGCAAGGAVGSSKTLSLAEQKIHNLYPLHWAPGRERRGLGQVVHKMNHIAIIVSDVGRSAAFYSQVMGFQQIRRPDFDRYGAWFTMGNVELHLIKGEPLVHDGKDLIVGHISIETEDIDKVPEILQRMGIKYRQNVSVPKGVMKTGATTNDDKSSNMIIKQYFFTDPDGYWIEICNCDILTEYCLGDREELAGYRECVGVNALEAFRIANLGITLANSSKRRAVMLRDRMQSEQGRLLKGGDPEEIAKWLGYYSPSCKVDRVKLEKLVVRRTIFGDLCQSESIEDLSEILRICGNSCPNALHVLQVRVGDTRVLRPPAFYEASRGTGWELQKQDAGQFNGRFAHLEEDSMTSDPGEASL